MKKILFVLVLLISGRGMLSAQTLAEWTQQNKTQKKYLLQQIAALQTHLGYIKEGYSIVQKGLTTISHIKQGEWDLHDAFFISLKTVSPAVKRYPKVAAILATQMRIIKATHELRKEANNDEGLTAEEKSQVRIVCTNLLLKCLDDVDDLATVITSGELEMTDAERIQRIEKIYSAVQEKQTFLQSFEGTLTLLAKGRKREETEINLSKKLNGLK